MDSDQVWINFTTMKNFLELSGIRKGKTLIRPFLLCAQAFFVMSSPSVCQ